MVLLDESDIPFIDAVSRVEERCVTPLTINYDDIEWGTSLRSKLSVDSTVGEGEEINSFFIPPGSSSMTQSTSGGFTGSISWISRSPTASYTSRPASLLSDFDDRDSYRHRSLSRSTTSSRSSSMNRKCLM